MQRSTKGEEGECNPLMPSGSGFWFITENKDPVGHCRGTVDESETGNLMLLKGKRKKKEIQGRGRKSRR